MRRKMRLLLPLIGVMVIGYGLWRYSPVRKLALRPEVSVTQAEPCRLITSITLYGTVQNQSAKALYLAETAQITEVFAEVGEPVTAGEVLLRAESAAGEGILPVFGDGAMAVFREWLGGTAAAPVYCAGRGGVITVESPIDGIVTDLSVRNGELCPAGSLCVTVADPNAQMICAAAPENHVRALREGMPCVITGDAFPEQEMTGKIVKIMPYATKELSLDGSGEPVVETWIAPDAPAEELVSGYSARAEVELENRQDVLTVPYTAVGQNADNQEYLFVYRDGIVEQRFITTGSELQDSVEVLDGLSAGEWYAVMRDGLSDGQAVRAVTA